MPLHDCPDCRHEPDPDKVRAAREARDAAYAAADDAEDAAADAALRAYLAPDDLGTAWAEAEAELPKGWVIGGLVFQYDTDPAIPNDWQAYAGSAEGHCRTCSCTPSVGCDGPTPAAALRALTARLKEPDRD